MNDQLVVAHALRCLQVLEDHPAPSHDISIATGMPLDACMALLERLHDAGMIRMDAEGYFSLQHPIEELSPLAILDAVWETFSTALEVQMLLGSFNAVAMALKTSPYVSDGNLA